MRSSDATDPAGITDITTSYAKALISSSKASVHTQSSLSST